MLWLDHSPCAAPDGQCRLLLLCAVASRSQVLLLHWAASSMSMCSLAMKHPPCMHNALLCVFTRGGGGYWLHSLLNRSVQYDIP